jgi:succinate dehydrogenase/fumarate reductase flavoprotein subunit
MLPVAGVALKGLGALGKGAMGAARLGGQAMVSPGIIGSITRWTAVGMVLSSLPNPTARRQAIDKALFEANREAQREYMTIREQFRRDAKSASIRRESDYRQQITSANFMDDPLEKAHAKKMARLTKTRHETEERFAKEQISSCQTPSELPRESCHKSPKT